MLKTASAITLVALVAGCASGDRTLLSAMKPSDDGFTYRAKFTMIYTLEGGEDVRRQWLAEHLRLNGTCPNGYEITDRQVVVTDEDAFSKVGFVDYTGRCV